MRQPYIKIPDTVSYDALLVALHQQAHPKPANSIIEPHDCPCQFCRAGRNELASRLHANMIETYEKACPQRAARLVKDTEVKKINPETPAPKVAKRKVTFKKQEEVQQDDNKGQD